jgi:hypothetical protein
MWRKYCETELKLQWVYQINIKHVVSLKKKIIQCQQEHTTYMVNFQHTHTTPSALCTQPLSDQQQTSSCCTQHTLYLTIRLLQR